MATNASDCAEPLEPPASDLQVILGLVHLKGILFNTHLNCLVCTDCCLLVEQSPSTYQDGHSLCNSDYAEKWWAIDTFKAKVKEFEHPFALSFSSRPEENLQEDSHRLWANVAFARA